MQKETFYITTPIFYANDKPHVGHAYTSIISDIISRYYKSISYDVFLSTGTDEHGIKVQKSALPQEAKNNNLLSVKFNIIQKYVDKMSKNFDQMMMQMHVEYNKFIRTSSIEHKNFVVRLWNKLSKKQYIYVDQYSGWYSERDEAFIKEQDLIDGKAPSGAKVKFIKEDVHFFKLSAFEDKLLEYYNNNPDAILPTSRRNEVLAYIKGGLRDLCISRTSIDWGIKVPDSNQHTIYVWVDALANYLSSINFDLVNIDKNKFWPCNLHVIGKDILIFHAVYWPAFLLALDLELPKHILAHGWWLYNNEKMSKSIGNTLSHHNLLQKFSSDTIRYCMIREMNIGNDGNISHEMIMNKYSSDLVNKIGNLVHRVLVFIQKKFALVVPYAREQFLQGELYLFLSQQIKLYHIKMKKFDIHKGLLIIMNIVNHCNTYLNENPIWEKETNTEKILYELVIAIYYIAVMLKPFMPDSSNVIFSMLNINNCSLYTKAEELFNEKHTINTPSPLFPRL